MKKIGLALNSLFYFAAGSLHFIRPAPYLKIVPPYLPWHSELVAISGFFEIVGGLGLLYAPTRRAAAWGLVALLVAVFPANIYMALHPERFADLHVARWLLWARLPLQGVLIAWIWAVSISQNGIRRRD